MEEADNGGLKSGMTRTLSILKHLMGRFCL
jgi:hypothetical protein